jgi:hypothetical protein
LESARGVNFQIKCDWRFQIKCDCIEIQADIIGTEELRKPTGNRLVIVPSKYPSAVGWNAGVVTNTADPFDSPEQVIIRKVVK